MHYGLELLTPPVGEPVSLAELKAQARIETDADDTVLTALITAARRWVEQETGLALLPQSWRLWLDCWPEQDALILPRAPLRSIVNVTLYDVAGNASTWSSAAYQADTTALPGRLLCNDGQSWPLPGRARRGIAISFSAGYADAASIPAPLQLALKQLATWWAEQRGDEAAQQAIPQMVRSLLAPYRLVSL